MTLGDATVKLSNEEGLVLPGYSKPESSWSDLDRASFAAGYLMSVMQACGPGRPDGGRRPFVLDILMSAS